ncbi:hypothetical protein BC629DRAFT_1437468 [Irpex lacteus]|nr:hypothetical protein BC629DRAFT_1437468 [Irpex lacteus]
MTRPDALCLKGNTLGGSQERICKGMSIGSYIGRTFWYQGEEENIPYTVMQPSKLTAHSSPARNNQGVTDPQDLQAAIDELSRWLEKYAADFDNDTDTQDQEPAQVVEWEDRMDFGWSREEGDSGGNGDEAEEMGSLRAYAETVSDGSSEDDVPLYQLGHDGGDDGHDGQGATVLLTAMRPIAEASDALLRVGGPLTLDGRAPFVPYVHGGGLPLWFPTPDEALARYARDGTMPPLEFAAYWMNRRTMVRQLKAVVDRAQDQGLPSFLDKYREAYATTPEMKLALATLFFPKGPHEGCPYLDPVEELEALQARVFLAVTNPFLEQHAIATLDRALAFRTTYDEAQYIVFLRCNGYLGGDWSVPAHAFQPPVARYNLLSC